MVNDFSVAVAKKRVPTTPFPPGLYLSKPAADQIDVKESKHVLKDLEYMCLTGGLLWASRMTFFECAVGCHYLTRLLATPTLEAYNAGIHMLAYMNANKSSGLRFRRVLNPTLVTYYDASNRGMGSRQLAAMWY